MQLFFRDFLRPKRRRRMIIFDAYYDDFLPFNTPLNTLFQCVKIRLNTVHTYCAITEDLKFLAKYNFQKF
jgi:hypothetical protein